MGSLQSFAAQDTNGRNAENQPFAAQVLDVSVADKTDLGELSSNGRLLSAANAAKHTLPDV